MNRELERVSSRLAEIEADIAASEGEITPDQEAEIDQLVRERPALAIEAMRVWKKKQAELKELVDQAKIALAFMDARAQSYKAKATTFMGEAGLKNLEGDTWKATYMPGRGRVEPVVPVEEWPDQYRKEKVTYQAETDLVRIALEAGTTPKTVDGRPIARLVVEDFVRVVDDKGKRLKQEIAQAIEETK